MQVQKKFRHTPPTGQNLFNVELDDGLLEVSSLFCKPTYRVHISVGVSSYPFLTVESLFDTGAGPILKNQDFLLQGGKESIKLIKRAATADGKLQSTEDRSHHSIVYPHDLSGRTHRIWDCRKPRRRYTAWNYVYPYRLQNNPSSLKATADHFDKEDE